MTFLILLFFHLLAVAILFAAMGIELAEYVALHRAQTIAQARAALSNSSLIGPLMGSGVLLLVAMGVAMVYVGGFAWQPWHDRFGDQRPNYKRQTRRSAIPPGPECARRTDHPQAQGRARGSCAELFGVHDRVRVD